MKEAWFRVYTSLVRLIRKRKKQQPRPRRGETREKVLAALHELGEASPKVVSEHTGLSHGAVKMQLHRMARKGLLVNRGGRYSLPSVSRSVTATAGNSIGNTPATSRRRNNHGNIPVTHVTDVTVPVTVTVTPKKEKEKKNQKEKEKKIYLASALRARSAQRCAPKDDHTDFILAKYLQHGISPPPDIHSEHRALQALMDRYPLDEISKAADWMFITFAGRKNFGVLYRNWDEIQRRMHRHSLNRHSLNPRAPSPRPPSDGVRAAPVQAMRAEPLPSYYRRVVVPADWGGLPR